MVFTVIADGTSPFCTAESTGPKPVARITRVAGSFIFAGLRVETHDRASLERYDSVTVTVGDGLAKPRPDHLATTELDGDTPGEAAAIRNGYGRRGHITARYHHLCRGCRRSRP
jgi:hypothetical protein